jgi:hypothetical protein
VTDHRGPAVARVALGTLEAVQRALEGELQPHELDELKADIAYLADRAKWNGEPLPALEEADALTS